MSDLIDRQQAIDEMVMLPKYFDKTGTLCLDYADVLAVLSEHLPSVEPKIIRCKDCVYRATDIDGELYCRKSTCDIDEDGFCSWGRKDNL